MYNLRKMEKFLETYNLPRLNQEEIENINRLINSNKIESVIKKIPTNKSHRPNSFTGKFCQTVKEELTPLLPKLFQKFEEKGMLPNLFYEASFTLIPKSKTQQEKTYRPILLMNIDTKILNSVADSLCYKAETSTPL